MTYTGQEIHITLQIAPAKIDLFNKIFEAYDHLAYVTTSDAGRGILTLRTSTEGEKDVRRVLSKLPFKTAILEA